VRALRIHEWGGPLRPEQVPDPRPGPGEVLLENEACSIGLTVLNCIRGDLGDDPAKLPRVPGHELVGTIVAVGAGVDPGRIGERAMAYFYLFCGRCRHCLAGAEPLCEHLAGFVGVDRDGGYAERTVLPARNAIALTGGHDPVLASAIPDAIATPVHVAARARIRPGDRVAVIAAGGGVGVHMVQVARLHGADVLGLEASEAKLRYLEEELGVAALDSSSFTGLELPACWRGRADVIVDLLGSEESLSWSLRALDADGRVLVLTTFRGVAVEMRPRDLVFAQGAVLGSRYARRCELELAARFVAEGRVRPIVTERAGTGEVEHVHEKLRQGLLLGRGALVWP
jgi:D-arabinose 1-dehydrogenase-like Zn-dependent alcohol dehydrogenase